MSYIVHKAIELKNIRKSSELARKQAMDPTYMARTFWRQLKYDGCNCVVVSYGNGDFEVFSRTGEVVKSMEHLRGDMERLPSGVYLGEAWLPLLTFPEISGIFRRQKVKPFDHLLNLVVFDYLTLEEWEAGATVYPYRWRYQRLKDHGLTGGFIRRAYTWTPEEQGKDWEIEGDLQADTTPQEIAMQLQEVGGYDGLILRDPEGTWTKGDEGGNGEIIKVKPRIRVSCQVVGYEDGKGKHAGRIGTLLITYKGKQQGAGTGLKDSERRIEEFESRWQDRLVEIEALGVTADGFLREPVLLGLRDDVLEAD